jgi:hypothetical protein
VAGEAGIISLLPVVKMNGNVVDRKKKECKVRNKFTVIILFNSKVQFVRIPHPGERTASSKLVTSVEKP